MLDANPPNLRGIPLGLASPPTQALGMKWYKQICEWKIQTEVVLKPLVAPALDVPPCEIGTRITS